ncbi:hypothetical protein K491DRAFT_717364 [Lophiostoma macrostomum CBS 122681]|uniref:Uncharacterized protein n=1 Tax=Lophiostoma macrostomum CBS 122681 TaxID=1314788 RepID=A0A6A6T3D2_9PLEO|nr:hypothetical protein K491DRAFT_717364 [Lophiostoma macrostomum CBS 122681]
MSTVSAEMPAHEVRDYLHRQLEESGFLDVDILACDLDNPIHPLFSKTKWKGVDDSLYAKMTPALQHASLWITDDRVLDWFYHDMTGVVVTTCEGVPFLTDNPAFDMQTNRGRETVRNLWLEKLDDLEKAIVFHLAEEKEEIAPTAVFGTCFSFAEEAKAWLEERRSLDMRHMSNIATYGLERTSHGVKRTFQEQVKPYVGISNLFRTFLECVSPSDGDIDRMQMIEMINCWFVLATTICHELAHAVGNFPIFRCFDLKLFRYVEPAHSLKEWNLRLEIESGFSWERFAQGFEATPYLFEHTSQMEYQLYEKTGVSPFRFMDSGYRRRGSTAALMIPPQDVVSWFRKSYWHPNRSSEDVRAPLFRPVEVTVLPLNYFEDSQEQFLVICTFVDEVIGGNRAFIVKPRQVDI